jgi:hypothetical protein
MSLASIYLSIILFIVLLNYSTKGRDVSEVVQNGAKTVRRYNYCRAL